MRNLAAFASVCTIGMLTLLGAGGAGARATVLTEVNILGLEQTVLGDFASGVVGAEKGKCVRNRPVKLQVIPLGRGGGFVTVDSARTSQRGAWALVNPIEVVDGLRVKAPRRRVGKDICDKDVALAT